MNDAAIGSATISPALGAQTLAVIVGSAALGIGVFLCATHRTAVLRSYMTFVTSLFLFVLSFWFSGISRAILALSPDSNGLAHPVSTIVSTLSGASFLAEAVGGIMLVLVLPRLTYDLFNRNAPAFRRPVSRIVALGMAGLALYTVLFGSRWAPLVLITLMYAVVTISIFELFLRIGFVRRTKQSGSAGTPASNTDLVAAVRVFLWVSIVFLPLFITDVIISLPDAGQWTQHVIVRTIDNLSVPLYFIVLAVGSVVFAYRFLNEPPLMADERVSAFACERYRLTEREAEVVEYIMEGFSVKDAATAMKISPKTVENHLYSVYQKTGVANRIQLFNLFESRRRS
ncbi:MAG: response regulator transcription factor [Spirochaetaceae bacterium]